jgi:transaldolase / glucose-6-phosphate isomerase
LVRQDIVPRFWAKDASLWPEENGQGQQGIAANLAWLDLPDQMGAYMAHVLALAKEAGRDGFQDVVYIAMGDSNLAAEAISHTTAAMRFRRLYILDSTDPAAILEIERKLDLGVTLFVLASKSGKRIETQALLLYFLERLKAQGISEPARRFIAVTEENSYLSELARSCGFLKTFCDPPGIRGRYSSLIHFGLLLSAVGRCDPAVLVSRAMDMRELCRRPEAGDKNPATGLAAFLTAGAIEGHDKLLLLSTPSLRASPYRIGQLVGTSTSKEGQGLIPICGALSKSLEIYQRGCIAAILGMGGDDHYEALKIEIQLEEARVPAVSIELSGPEEFGSELFKWEIATALTCASLHVNPFTEPDVQQESRGRVSQILEGLSAKNEWPARTARVREKGIELYAEGETRQQISTLSLSEALRTFFEARNPDGYLAIITFAGDSPETEGALGRIRERLASRMGIPVLLSSGPRYLQYLEQVYKGGPPEGLFLILTHDPVEDVVIPGAGYTFGQLQLALALADFESLESCGKLVVWLHLARGVLQGLAEIEQMVQKL